MLNKTEHLHYSQKFPPFKKNNNSLLALSFYQKRKFAESNLKTRDAVCLLNPNWELAPLGRGPEAERFASYFTFKDPGKHR